ncbi:hypothetical protein ACWS7L_13545 [Exiguobacterium artemiae]|uniref:hypothetical protein n=1 Tax=Exiguobacterium sp. S22-S28 TaxID=3342768 RepID=UPI00372D75E6
MFNKLIAAGLTAIVTSGLITLISYISAVLDGIYDDNDVYFSVIDLFVIYTISSFPIILISGNLVDFFVKQIAPFFPVNRNIFLLKSTVYVVFGGMVALIFLLPNHEGNYTFSNFSFLLLALSISGLSAFFYFWISLQLKRRKSHIS